MFSLSLFLSIRLFSFSVYASVRTFLFLPAPHELGNREINIVGASHIIANLYEEYGVKLGALLTSGPKGRRGPATGYYTDARTAET